MFSHSEAFSRNIGWVTQDELKTLRTKRVAIAGMGGVGGAHLLTLTRLGIEKFNITDFDVFETVNFNRQVGAGMPSIGQRKAPWMFGMASDINPNILGSSWMFSLGLDHSNVEDFLDDVDLYVDGLDFFAFEARSLVFAECAKRGIPAITAAPLGMGASLLNFLPGGMTFEQYFKWGDAPDEVKAAQFLRGLSPTGMQSDYLVDASTINLAEKRGPSTMMACNLCAGMAGTEALKILLNRGGVLAAPSVIHFDAYTYRLVIRNGEI